MAKYVYPAVFEQESDGKYSVYFPDLDGCYTSGDDLADAIHCANDVLAFTLYQAERDGIPVAPPSAVDSIPVSAGDFVSYVLCDTDTYRRMKNNRAVKKTLTIPEWLNEAAVAADMNFSQVLQDALKE